MTVYYLADMLYQAPICNFVTPDLFAFQAAFSKNVFSNRQEFFSIFVEKLRNLAM